MAHKIQNPILNTIKQNKMARTTQQTETAPKVEAVMNAEVKTFQQVITDSETGVLVKKLYYLRIVRGNVTVQINVGEKTYTQIKTLTEEKI